MTGESVNKYIVTASVIFAAVLSGPLVDEVKDVFGTTVLYHPVTIWVVLMCIVYGQTKSLQDGIFVVLGYEALKLLWRTIKPETPKVSRVRKILHNVNQDSDLSDADVRFLNEVTPESVVVAKKEELKAAGPDLFGKTG